MNVRAEATAQRGWILSYVITFGQQLTYNKYTITDNYSTRKTITLLLG